MELHAGRKAGVFWFTGLSGAGKTTLSLAVAEALRAGGLPCLVLDGDVCRKGLCRDLGFSAADRQENVRRVGEVAALCVAQGVTCLCAFITPLASMRRELRRKLGSQYHEVHVDCALQECMKRDVKSLYAQVRQGSLKQFTGVDSPYEVPSCPDLRVDTEGLSVDHCVARVLAFVSERLAFTLPLE